MLVALLVIPAACAGNLEEPVVADIGMPSPALLDSAGPDFVGDRGIYQPEAVAYPLGLDRDEVGSTAESRDRSVST